MGKYFGQRQGQQQVETKSNEKTAIPKLLKSLDLTDTIVMIDAIACELKMPT
jgi:predicted transposase YbfD/YdcC